MDASQHDLKAGLYRPSGPGVFREGADQRQQQRGGQVRAEGDIIDAGNYVPRRLRDGRIDAIEAGQPESEWVQAQLRHPVIKAFNTIRPASLATLGTPAGSAGRTAIPVAGDDPSAKPRVLELVDQMGFDGLDAGALAESRRQQPGTPVYTTDLSLDEARQALAAATRQQTISWRSQGSHRQETGLVAGFPAGVACLRRA